MLTAGDVQFEPQQSKIRQLTSSIVAMIAGDSSMQEEILQNVQKDITKKIEEEPSKWVSVSDVTEFYRVRCNEARNKRSENSILAPLGLTHSTFLSQQALMNGDLIVKLATELINFRPPDVEAIITGIDSTGAHIYVVRNSNVACQDGVGFAAIGAGYWHANSQFMFSGHTRSHPLPETLLLAYSAKRRAEVAPGVGREGTDMFFIPNLGGYSPIGDHVLKELSVIYKSERKKETAIEKQSRERINEYVEKITPPPTPVTEQGAVSAPDSGGNPPADAKDVRDDAEEGKSGDKPKPD
jgi:hypothetical protein